MYHMCLQFLEAGVGIEFVGLGIWPGMGWAWFSFPFFFFLFFFLKQNNFKRESVAFTDEHKITKR